MLSINIEPQYNGVGTTKAHLVGIATDARDASDPKIKRRQLVIPSLPDRQPGLLEVRHDEATKAAIDVHTYVVGGSKFTKRDNIVLISVWEIHGGPD
jgi:hypothetical protein